MTTLKNRHKGNIANNNCLAPIKSFLEESDDGQEIDTTAQNIFMSCSSEHFYLEITAFLLHEYQKYLSTSFPNRASVRKTSVISQDIVDTSRGPTDIKMPCSSTPEFRAAPLSFSECPSSLRSVDLAISNEQRVDF